MSANWITIWGFGQYAVVHGRGEKALEVTWHATVFYAVLGLVSLGGMALFGEGLLPYLDAPDAAKYLPGMCLALYIKRLGAMPERVLTRRMQFRASGMALALGEMSYAVTAVSFAAGGYGAWSIVIGNLVQSTVCLAILVKAAGIREWATPMKLRAERVKHMLAYGVPLGIQGIAGQAARYWDRLAITYFFGPAATGVYNNAYNLADVPAIQVGEQIALVLMPSMAELPPERRPRALERSTALLSLIIFPLAVGLGLVAGPLIAILLPANEWQEVAPLLSVLACLSIFRPFTWVISAYLEAESKTNRLMLLEIGKLVVLIGGIAALNSFGLLVASGSVGIAFGATAIAGVLLVVREGVSVRRLLVGFMQPVLACCVMALVVWLVYRGLIALDVTHPSVLLVAMVLTGAFSYVCAALVIARESSRDLLQLVKKALRRP
jgi:PST family polysaccharide transporter